MGSNVQLQMCSLTLTYPLRTLRTRLSIDSPTKDTKDKVEHEKGTQNDERYKIDPVKIAAKCIICLKRKNTHTEDTRVSDKFTHFHDFQPGIQNQIDVLPTLQISEGHVLDNTSLFVNYQAGMTLNVQ